jgi:nucleoside-diphosphate-sugar epimerase
MSPVLLTGATGFIGRHLQKTLLADGFAVTALVRPGSAHAEAVASGANRLTGELFDVELLGRAVAGAAAVIYAAGTVRGRCLQDFEPANIAGVRHLAEAMNACAPDTPLLLISSLAASRPEVSDYANSKYQGEQALVRHARFPWTIFRPPAVYGPGDREMLPVLKMVRRGWVAFAGPSRQRLSLIHVADLSSAVLAWLKARDRCTGQVYSLDDGHTGGYSWDEIAAIVCTGRYRKVQIPGWLLSAAGRINLGMSRVLGYAPMLTPGKARELTQTSWVCNNTPLSEALGWTPAVPLDAGVNELFGNTGIQG